ncbi:ribbon-helix-helix protein, CopG family [Thermosulfurimonas sp.]|uniref:ribbon-helix-helix protein, CopG family n=1 Tax=Thermosulfurimonas sp. TaxID=2080236 RepID=UPI0025F2FF3F|nr:ribbon-helix-helix protein, CopG family [Thermosulfurimonas sp.]
MAARLCISLSEEEVRELKELSRQTGQSVSALVRWAISEWLFERQRKKLGEELRAKIREKPRASEEAFEELEAIRGTWR